MTLSSKCGSEGLYSSQQLSLPPTFVRVSGLIYHRSSWFVHESFSERGMQKEQIIFMLIQSYPKFISVKKKLNIYSITLRFVVVVTGHDITYNDALLSLNKTKWGFPGTGYIIDNKVGISNN